jgi:hypothetical protein
LAGTNGFDGIEEKCSRCGTAIYPFSSRTAMSDMQRYCISCAEKLDAVYLHKNSCSLCGRLFRKHEVKFVLPSSVYGEAAMPLQERLACNQCYRKSQRRSRLRMVRTDADAGRGRGSFSNQIIKQLIGR